MAQAAGIIGALPASVVFTRQQVYIIMTRGAGCRAEGDADPFDTHSIRATRTLAFAAVQWMGADVDAAPFTRGFASGAAGRTGAVRADL